MTKMTCDWLDILHRIYGFQITVLIVGSWKAELILLSTRSEGIHSVSILNLVQRLYLILYLNERRADKTFAKHTLCLLHQLFLPLLTITNFINHILIT